MEKNVEGEFKLDFKFGSSATSNGERESKSSTFGQLSRSEKEAHSQTHNKALGLAPTLTEQTIVEQSNEALTDTQARPIYLR